MATQKNQNGPSDPTSNIFRYQTEELLQSVKTSSCEERIAYLDAALRRIKKIVENLPDKGPLTVLEAERELRETHNVTIPFPQPPPDSKAKYTFSYSSPSDIQSVGGFLRQTVLQTTETLTIDLAVTMPRKMFQEKDYLNYRYFYKRAFYLACIAAGISQAAIADFQVDYALLNDNQLQPVIIIKIKEVESDVKVAQHGCQIRLLLAAPSDLFPVERTFLAKNCMRSMPCADPVNLLSADPTPFYNSSLRSECCFLLHMELLHNAALSSESFNDACILGDIWLRQRGFGPGVSSGGFGAFEWACTMALLMQGGGPHNRPILSKGYSSHQFFKAMLLYLSVTDMIQVPVCTSYEGITALDGHGPVLFDGARGLNILYKMSPCSYTLLRHEATRTVELLNGSLNDNFEACFITKVDNPMHRFDLLARFSLDRESVKKIPSTDAHDDITRYCLQTHRLIKHGLNDRAVLVHIQPEAPSLWAITTGRSRAHKTSTLVIGLLLNPNLNARTVDRGPSAEETAAASEFRDFWGDKAELRRFKDGSIVESLVWTPTSSESVVEQILKHVLRRHLGEKASNSLSILEKSFANILPANSLADPVALYQPVMTAYEHLEKQIRSLVGLPLQIHHIVAGDAQLRYTALDVPWANSAACHMTTPANVYIQFEGSSRWPDDLAAVQRTKIAMLLKLGEMLLGLGSKLIVAARLGLESQAKDLSNLAFLDVSYTDGALFRLRVHHEPEVRLLERLLASVSSSETKAAVAATLSFHKRIYIQSPLHTQAVRTMCTRNAILSPSIRLMKKWRDAHLLSNHISDELIELLTIHTLVQSYPWAAPGSILTSFVRTLTFISRWDWRSEPLIVDFSGEMEVAAHAAIRTRFDAWRKIDPAMNRIAVFAASNVDTDGVSWTELGPSKVVATRLTCLARAACAFIKEHGLAIKAAALFTPTTSDYDFVVHLNVQYVAKDAGDTTAKKSEYKNLQLVEQRDPLSSTNRPVLGFVEELRAHYQSNVIFFYNEGGGGFIGGFIGGLWNPQTGPRLWKLKAGYSTFPMNDKGEEVGYIAINKKATLHDIAKLGGDLISKIEEMHR